MVSQTDKYVCVCLSNDHHMGGPHPYGYSEWYTFRTDTGEQLFPSDAADASPEEIESFLLSELEELNRVEYDGIIEMSTFEDYDADDYSFFIEDGKLYAAFNRYEGLFYAAGVLPNIELPMGLKADLR